MSGFFNTVLFIRAIQHSQHDGTTTGDNNNPGDHTVTPAFATQQPGLDYSMQRSPRDALYPPPHMVSSHIQSNFKFDISK